MLQRSEKCFILNAKGKADSVSVDRSKPAYLLNESNIFDDCEQIETIHDNCVSERDLSDSPFVFEYDNDVDAAPDEFRLPKCTHEQAELSVYQLVTETEFLCVCVCDMSNISFCIQ